jgi:hypothetical protein
MGPGPLFANADTINLDDEQLPAVMVHRGIHLQIRRQSGDELGRISEWLCICIATIPLGRIVDDMGEIAVQGQQNCVDFSRPLP